jgi:hypothetical protein
MKTIKVRKSNGEMFELKFSDIFKVIDVDLNNNGVNDITEFGMSQTIINLVGLFIEAEQAEEKPEPPKTRFRVWEKGIKLEPGDVALRMHNGCYMMEVNDKGEYKEEN